MCSSQRLAQFSFGGLMGSKRNVFAFKCSRSVILTRRYRMFLTCWSSLRGLSPGQDTCWWFAAVITESAVCFSSTWKWAPVIASFLFSDFLLHTGLLRPQSLFYILHVRMRPSHTSGSATACCCFWKSRNAQRSEARFESSFSAFLCLRDSYIHKCSANNCWCTEPQNQNFWFNVL